VGFTYAKPTTSAEESASAIFSLLLFGLLAGFLLLAFVFILFSAFVSHRVPPFFVRLTVFPSMVAPSTPIRDREHFLYPRAVTQLTMIYK
jgi:hypothetical protein